MYSRKEFIQMVEKALAHLPELVKQRMKNVAVCVANKPTRRQLKEIGMRKEELLLGLFEGVPETEWGKGFGNILPDKITLFQENIEKVADTPEEIEREIQATVKHEIAHHFGFSDEDLEQKKI
jgi:predicted Zn-dependent protease with MMP-like domain